MSLEYLLRFKDLQLRNIAKSWPQLRLMIDRYGFPPGFLLGVNSRAWRVSDVEQWLASRPVQPSEHVMKRAAKSIRATAAARSRLERAE
jgi:predicted DNA-binding transcriptional regulator AlpA